ncbi:MAG TPA: hypothetical protein VL443_15470 [Cyclobacteriaceae bacterium]|nr:hypothetical protein [Cyclobacteriaceae bacterium]
MIRNQLYSCPSCQLSCIARSDETILLTCRHCGTVISDNNAKKYSPAPVPEDWSFIQIGTKGIFNNKDFVVIGRIRFQLRNDYKNCWTIIYNDNQLGWLIESMGSLAIFETKTYSLSVEHTSKLKANVVIKIGKDIKVTGEYVEKCETLSYEGEVGPWKDLSTGFFMIQASSNNGTVLMFTVRPQQDSLYIVGKKTDLQQLKLENSIEWNEWK